LIKKTLLNLFFSRISGDISILTDEYLLLRAIVLVNFSSKPMAIENWPEKKSKTNYTVLFWIYLAI
jgi:hypothetical protein